MQDANSATARILIIDDDESFRKILELRLRSFMPSMTATIYGSISEAREFLREQSDPSFDLVILDEHLPDGSGRDLLNEGWFESLAVLMVSSDTAPEIPGASLQAGARFFLNKMQIKEDLFQPLVRGIIDRNKLQHQLNEAKMRTVVMETVRTLVGTLRHEINNPLGAVLGAAYILKTSAEATGEQVEAAALVESSGQRIKHVLNELCTAVELEPVQKANQKVFHVPGDKPWEEKK